MPLGKDILKKSELQIKKKLKFAIKKIVRNDDSFKVYEGKKRLILKNSVVLETHDLEQ